MSEQDFIEPDISLNYLRSYKLMLPFVTAAFGLARAKHEPYYIVPEPLTSYDLQVMIDVVPYFFGEKRINLRVQKRDGTNVNNRVAGCLLTFVEEGDDAWAVSDHYDNHTHRGSQSKDKPVRNVSGILAPYEDAVCQYVADVTGKKVHREIITGQKADSRFVRNFLNRGFAPVPGSVGIAEKVFQSSKK